MKKLLASCAALALACSPSLAAWYPGFTGTGQVAATAAPASGSYVGPGDLLLSGQTMGRFYSFRAMSAAAAAAGAYAARVCGDDASGSAASTVCADLRVGSNGALVLTPVVPGTGSVTTNPCFKGYGNCRVAARYDQSTQTTTASTSGASESQSTLAYRPYFYGNLANIGSGYSAQANDTQPAMLSFASQYLVDSSIASASQPFYINTVAARRSNTDQGAFFGIGGSSNLALTGSAGANSWTFTAGNATAIAVTDGSPTMNSVGVVVNGASGIAQSNGTTTSGLNFGGNTISAYFESLSDSTTGTSGTGQNQDQESFYITGSAVTATQAANIAKNQSAFFGLGF